MPAMPTTERRWALRSSAEVWKSSLTRRSSRLRPHERRLQTLGAEGAPGPAHHSQGPPQVHRLGPSLDLVDPGVLVDQGGLGGPPGGLAHQHRAWSRQPLHPGGRVHEVARHHPLPLGPEGHRRLPGEDRGPGLEARGPHLLPQGGHGLHQLEGGPHRPLRVVLPGHRRPPERHDGVPDELLDGPPVPPHQAAGGLEVPGEEVPDGLGVPLLRERREPHQVSEQDRDQAAFRLGTRARGTSGRGLGFEGDPALPAEPEPLDGLGPAGRTPPAQGPPARPAEPKALGVVEPAGRAGRHGRSLGPGPHRTRDPVPPGQGPSR